jgi:thiamine-phosphate pyrophosphorylase
MKIIAISDFKKCKDPFQITRLFEMGLDRFHVKEDLNELKVFLEGMDKKYLDQISYHGDGRMMQVESHGKFDFSKSESCHAIVEVLKSDKEYCFLSPIYDSISKKGYQSSFDFKELNEGLRFTRKANVFALGGITNDNLQEAIQLGFDGVAIKGFLWDLGNDPVEQFAKLI